MATALAIAALWVASSLGAESQPKLVPSVHTVAEPTASEESQSRVDAPPSPTALLATPLAGDGPSSALAEGVEGSEDAKRAKKQRALQKRKERRRAAQLRAERKRKQKATAKSKAKATKTKANKANSAEAAPTPPGEPARSKAGASPSKSKPKRDRAATTSARTEPTGAGNGATAGKRKRRIHFHDVEPTELEKALTSSLVLDVSTPGPYRLWGITLHNAGASPVVLYDDPRLLWFEVTPPGAKKSKICRLPKEMIPSYVTDTSRVALAPGQNLTHWIEPRFYCFDSSGVTDLVAGTQVQAHYGWETNQRLVWEGGKQRNLRLEQHAPYVVKAARGDEQGLRETVGLPVTLGAGYDEWKANAPPAKPGLQLMISKSADAPHARDVTVDVTVRNATQLSQTVYWRADQLEFSIVGANGTVVCEADSGYRAEDPQSLLRLRAGKTSNLRVRLREFCATEDFDAPGLYYIGARLALRGGRWEGDPVKGGNADEEDDSNDDTVNELVTDMVPLRIRRGEDRFSHWEPDPEITAPRGSAPANPADSP